VLQDRELQEEEVEVLFSVLQVRFLQSNFTTAGGEGNMPEWASEMLNECPSTPEWYRKLIANYPETDMPTLEMLTLQQM
jgi:hypothetical protein